MKNIPAAWRAIYGTPFDLKHPQCVAFANGFNAGRDWAIEGGD